MKIININNYRLAFFKVENTLHVTVSNLDDQKTIDYQKLYCDEFNKAIKKVFEGVFERQLSSFTNQAVPSLFDSTKQVLIIILK